MRKSIVDGSLCSCLLDKEKPHAINYNNNNTTLFFFTLSAQILDDENDLTNFEMSIQFEAPLIEPHDEDVTLDVGSNFTLRCSSKYPVTWTTLHDPDPTSFIITSLPAPIPDRPYGSTIKLINVNFNHVGYYYCLREETKQLLVPGQESEYLDNPYHSSKIYVFVDGEWDIFH